MQRLGDVTFRWVNGYDIGEGLKGGWQGGGRRPRAGSRKHHA
jgi:hypothetical protein